MQRDQFLEKEEKNSSKAVRYGLIVHYSCTMKHKERYYLKEFKPSGKSFDEYPRINKHFKRPTLIRKLEIVCQE